MASARESHWICAGPGFWILAAPADSFLRISSLPSIADGQNQHGVVGRPPSIEGEERLTSARNHQLPATVFDRAPDQRVMLENHDSFTNPLHRVQGAFRISLRDVLEYVLAQQTPAMSDGLLPYLEPRFANALASHSILKVRKRFGSIIGTTRLIGFTLSKCGFLAEATPQFLALRRPFDRFHHEGMRSSIGSSDNLRDSLLEFIG